MDPCRELRRQLIQTLQGTKTQGLREAEEGAKPLQEAARLAVGDSALQEAHGRWQRYQRDVLFAAHRRAQELDLQIWELMRAPCDVVRSKALALGIVEPEAPEAEAEDSLPAATPAEREVVLPPAVESKYQRAEPSWPYTPPVMAPSVRGEIPQQVISQEPAPLEGPTGERAQEPGAGIELAAPVADPTAVTLDQGEREPVRLSAEGPAGVVVEHAIKQDEAAVEPTGLDREPREPAQALEAAEERPVGASLESIEVPVEVSEVTGLPEEPVPALEVVQPPEAPGRIADAGLDEEAVAAEPASWEEAAEPVAPEPYAPRSAEKVAVRLPLPLVGEPAEYESSAEPTAPGLEGEMVPTPDLAEDQREPSVREAEAAVPETEGAPRLPLELIDAEDLEEFDAIERERAEMGVPAALAEEAEAPFVILRRTLPAWLVPAIATVSGLALIGAVVVLLLNSGVLRSGEATPAAGVPAATTAAQPVVATTPTDTVVSVLPSPPPATPTRRPTPEGTSAPAAAPTSTSTPTATVQPPPTSTSTTEPTPEPTVVPTSSPTPEPTATPVPPQVLVDATYNVRGGPGTSYDRIGQVSAGDILDILARNADGTWWQVCCVEGETAWILGELAPSQGNTADIALAVDIPPSPTPAPAPTARPVLAIVPEELAGTFAFPVFDPGRRVLDLYIANADGTGLERVLEQASQPALSPDGSRIAFRRWWGGGRGITVMSTLGGDTAKYSAFHEDALPSWSSDGRSLVFFSRRESDRKPRFYAVNLVDGSEREILRDRQPIHGEYPTWRADGSIVYRMIWPQRGLAIMNEDGSGERVVLLDDSATAPAASPDGVSIAFMSQRDGNWEIYRIKADGGEPVRLTENSSNDGLPAWSPDGNALAFLSDRDGSWAIWAMTSEGDGLARLFALPGSPNAIVPDEPDYITQGWVEERLSWSR